MRLKPLLFSGMCLASALLSGCSFGTPSSSDVSPTAGQFQPAPSFAEAARRALRASAAGSAYDRGLLALRRDDNAGVSRAADDLRAAGATREARRLVLAPAARLVVYAITLDGQAQNSKGATRERIRAQAGEQYRAAQKLMPQFDSDSPLILNALGYFLAERGTSSEDFREAERLTRRALQLFDKQINALSKADAGNEFMEQQRKVELAGQEFSRANTRDSLAWALFRQKRFEDARIEQERAVRDAERNIEAIGQPMPPELHFHLGEILRALQRDDEARRQYEAALKLNPDDPSREALDALNRDKS